MKAPEWWWSIVWGTCMWIGSALFSGYTNPIGFGMFIGCTWGALLMWWNIKLVEVK